MAQCNRSYLYCDQECTRYIDHANLFCVCVHFRMMEAAKSEIKQKSHSNRMKLLEDLPPPVR